MPRLWTVECLDIFSVMTLIFHILIGRFYCTRSKGCTSPILADRFVPAHPQQVPAGARAGIGLYIPLINDPALLLGLHPQFFLRAVDTGNCTLCLDLGPVWKRPRGR